MESPAVASHDDHQGPRSSSHEMANQMKQTELADEEVQSTPLDSQGSKVKSFGFHMSVLALVMMAFIVSLDATILAVAIPTSTNKLNGTTLEAFWASISFLLVVVVTQPIYTNVSNVIGRMLPLYISFVFFIAGSIIFALSKNMTVLITGRVFQGLGGGGLDVFNEILLADITTLKERPMYLGLMEIPVALGSVLGPIIGGLLTEHASWRWVGWINLPVCAVNLILVFFFLKLNSLQDSLHKKFMQLDFIGLALFIVGCTLTATPIAWAGVLYAWSSYKTLLPLFPGLTVLGVFWWYESRPEEPVFPRSIFRSLTSCSALIATFLHGVLVYGTIFFAPLFFQAVFLQTPMKSAISVLPITCTSVAFGIVGALVVETTRAYRYLILVSWVFAAVGAGLITLWTRHSSLAMQVAFQLLLGIGTGNLFSILHLPLQASLSNPDDMGVAAGVLVAFRLFGALLGLSIGSTLFSSVFSKSIQSLGHLPDSVSILHDAREAVGFVPLLRKADVSADVLEKLTNTYMRSMYAVFWMFAGVAVFGFIVSLFIREKSIEQDELGRQQYQDTDP